MVAMYAVSKQSSHEGFEESASGQSEAEQSPPPVVPSSPESSSKQPSPTISSGAAHVGVSDADESERIDAMVFKAYMDTFGVPPTPSHTKHYAGVARVEKLDEASLRARINKDSRDAIESIAKATTGSGAQIASATPNVQPPAGGVTTTTSELDADLQALRDKAASIATMNGPVTPPQSMTDQLGSKLREIASQVSTLARQYDVPLNGQKQDTPHGVESFINLCR